MNSINDPRQWEYVMYILVNNDIGMGKGKIASQCCHSACRMTRVVETQGTELPGYKEWIRTGEAKIVLKATHEQLQNIMKTNSLGVRGFHMGHWCVQTIDSGRTQIEPGSLTSVAFCPMRRKDTPDVIKTLKLM